ncbi:hypothetical protein [Solemya velesiana gill symbiont]|uniref:hypothetical protein n=1 Tax=Solemya velesiana gill symbiont TaxID=1918948 RepID=UPI0015608398|nr:hypothetical protein [Solemya velesiana gill symbiont]
MFFEWDDAYNMGVDVIDHQHRRIVDYINTLYQAIGRSIRQSGARMRCPLSMSWSN